METKKKSNDKQLAKLNAINKIVELYKDNNFRDPYSQRSLGEQRDEYVEIIIDDLSFELKRLDEEFKDKKE